VMLLTPTDNVLSGRLQSGIKSLELTLPLKTTLAGPTSFISSKGRVFSLTVITDSKGERFEW
jgi:hypothetical protein